MSFYFHFEKSIVSVHKHAELAARSFVVHSFAEKVFTLHGWKVRLRRLPTGDYGRASVKDASFGDLLYATPFATSLARHYVNYLRKVTALGRRFISGKRDVLEMRFGRTADSPVAL